MKDKKSWGIKGYLFLLMAVSLILTGTLWLIDPILFFIVLPFVLAVNGLVLWQIHNLNQKVYKMMDGVVEQLDASQRNYLHNFPLPVVIVTEGREIVWYSPSFSEKILLKDELYGTGVDLITTEPLSVFCTAEGKLISYENRWYRVLGVEKQENDVRLYTLYFLDVTQVQQEAILYRLTRPSVMLIMLDNYGEIMQQAKESENQGFWEKSTPL